MAGEFWENRYKGSEYAYGKAPNTYFRKYIDRLSPGSLLLPGEGEGRNAVYAASCGWQVTALDQSLEGKRKALKLGGEKSVQFTYHTGDITSFKFENETFDMIALIYFHLPPDVRLFVHKNIYTWLKKGGYLLMESFSKEQLGKASGGPQAVDLLYDTYTLRRDFQKMEIKELYRTDEILDEGEYHRGKASLVRMLAIK